MCVCVSISLWQALCKGMLGRQLGIKEKIRGLQLGDWFAVPALLHDSTVTFGKSHGFSRPPFPYL